MINFKVELWKDLECGYSISSYGRFKRHNKLISGWIAKNGYRMVNIKNKKYYVHRLVAQSFIPKAKDNLFVNHMDLNKLNNNINNLEWITHAENIQHARRHGVFDYKDSKFKERKIRAKIIIQYDLLGNELNRYRGSVEAERYLKNKHKNIKVNARNIRSVCQGDRKTAGGFYWEYL